MFNPYAKRKNHRKKNNKWFYQIPVDVATRYVYFYTIERRKKWNEI